MKQLSKSVWVRKSLAFLMAFIMVLTSAPAAVFAIDAEGGEPPVVVSEDEINQGIEPEDGVVGENIPEGDFVPENKSPIIGENEEGAQGEQEKKSVALEERPDYISMLDTAMALGDVSPLSDDEPAAPESDTIASGDCGPTGSEDSVKWALYEDGTLVISGTGPMANRLSGTAAAWRAVANQIEKVVIEEGVTTLVYEAFDNSTTATGNKYTQLTSITIPASMATIDSYAFYSAPTLNSLTFKGLIPPGTTSSSFSSIVSGGKIHVPAEAIAAYASWKSGISTLSSWTIEAIDDGTLRFSGPSVLNLDVGYEATSTDTFTVLGDPVPVVSIVSGNELITWNDATKKLDIAEGLTGGAYQVVLKAENDNGSIELTFTLSILAAPILLDGFYQISSGADLGWFADKVNGGQRTINAKLIADIDLSEIDSWTPIGINTTNNFGGIFDGAGYVISDMNISSSANTPTGLFGVINGGTVKNLTVSGVINAEVVDRVGGIVGTLTGVSTIENCINKVDVTGKISVGGIIGYVDSSSVKTITNCINLGEVNGSENVGGLVGYFYYRGELSSSYNRGTVNATGTNGRVGGLVGYMNDGNAVVKNSYTTGEVTGTANVGAAVGQRASGTVADCFALEGLATTGYTTGITFRDEEYMKSSAFTGDLGGSFIRDASGTINDGYPIFGWQDPNATYEIMIIITPANAQLTFGPSGNASAQPIAEDGVYTFDELLPGDFEYTVSEEDGDYIGQDGSISISYGNVRKSIDLQRNTYEVTFAVTPENAIVSITEEGFEQTKTAASGETSFTLPAGTYTYSVERFGYITETGAVIIAKRTGAEIETVVLEESQKYDLTFDVTPGAAVVKVTHPTEGLQTAESGTTYNLYRGNTYDYTVRLKGYLTVKDTVTIGDSDDTITIVMEEGIASWDGETATEPDLVEGVYQISDPEHLAWFRDKVNSQLVIGTGGNGSQISNSSTSSTIKAILLNDIDLGDHEWAPIGTFTVGSYSATGPYGFAGTFDGNGNTIAGLSITTGANGSGLFGVLMGAAVKDLTVSGSIIGGQYTGGIAGYSTGNTTKYPIGTTITNCTNNVDITVAYTGTSSTYVGGITGMLTNVGYSQTLGVIEHCANYGTINGGTSNRQIYFGGIVGSANYGIGIRFCSNESDINGVDYIGGIAGSSNILVTSCYNNGSITASTSTTGVGGIVGEIGSTGKIKDCYNTGSVNGTTRVGGVAGYLNDWTPANVEFANCYNVGTVTASTGTSGAVIGEKRGSSGGVINNVVFNTYFLEGTSAGGIGLMAHEDDVAESITSEELSSAEMSVLLGDSFVADTNNQNSGYPVLAWQNLGGVVPDTNAELAAAIDILVDAIGEVEYTEDTLSLIVVAEEAFESASEEVKELVAKTNELEEARATFDGLVATALDDFETIINLIPSLSEIALTDEAAINSAADAFEALLMAEQLAVSDSGLKQKLDESIAKLKELKRENLEDITVTVAVTDNEGFRYIMLPTEITVTEGLAAEYGYSNATPDHLLYGIPHGVNEGEITALDALFAAHELKYGVGFNPTLYLSGPATSANITKMFGIGPHITFTANDRTPIGDMSDGYAINEYVLQDGDSLVFTKATDDSWGMDLYSYFETQNFTVEPDEPFELTLKGFDAIDQMMGTPGDDPTPALNIIPIPDATIMLIKPDGTLDLIDSEEDFETDADGKVTLSFSEQGTYYLTALGIMTNSWYITASTGLPFCKVVVEEAEEEPDPGTSYVTFIMPQGATLFVGQKTGVHFTRFTEKVPRRGPTDNGDGTVTYIYQLSDNAPNEYNYRVSQSGKVTYTNKFTNNATFRGNGSLVTVTQSQLDADGKTPSTIDRALTSNNNRNIANVYLNINEKGYLAMTGGDEFQIVNMRNWQAVDTDTNNYFIEPDYHYMAIDVNGGPSSVATVDENGKITAIGEGTAIVLVTYDALTYAAAGTGPFFGAIWPENTGVILVSVGETHGFETGMKVPDSYNVTNRLMGSSLDSELDVIYYDAAEEGAYYNFTPASGSSVNILRPILTDTAMSFSGGFVGGEINGVTEDEGLFTVRLIEGRNIIKIENSGKTEYQIITAKKTGVTITNNTRDDETFMPGDSLTVVFDAIHHPANKLAGIYNMSARLAYSLPGGTAVTGTASQYNFAANANTQKMTFTIPESFEGDEFVLSNGRVEIPSSGLVFGDAYGNHRSVTYETGRPANMSASARPGDLSILPDITIPVGDGVTDSDKITVYFTLLGDDKHGELDDEDEVHTYTKGNLAEWLAEAEFVIDEGSTLWDLFQSVLTKAGMTWSNTGNYIDWIEKDGEQLGSADNGPASGWMYLINGVYGQNGLELEYLNNGDKITFHYTDDYTQEFADFGIDKTVLNNLILVVEALDPNNYMAEEWEPVAEALLAAKAVSYDELATQDEIDAAVLTLSEALSGLPEGPVVDPIDYEPALQKVISYIINTVKEPSVGSIGGEWTILALARYGAATPIGYYDDYLAKAEAYIATYADADGKLPTSTSNLNNRRATENARLTIALSSIGKSAESFAGIDLVSALADPSWATSQGINAAIFALLALDTKPYLPEDNDIRTILLSKILDSQLDDGGWAYNGDTSDPDMTAMALQALAPHKSSKTQPVATAIESGITALSTMQLSDGGFAATLQSGGVESIAQAIVALSTLGIDVQTDVRFQKIGGNLLSALLSYQNATSGAFAHTKGGGDNLMSTEQAAYALVAYDRFMNKKNTLYDMTDVKIEDDKPAETDVSKDALEVATKIAAMLDEEAFTPASWQVLTSTLSVARTVLADENATQGKIDAAYNALTRAIDALKPAENPADPIAPITPTAPVNKTALNVAITQANSLTQSTYTASSWAAFTTVLSIAKTIFADANATQADVDYAKDTLLKVIGNLVDKKSETTTTPQATTPTTSTTPRQTTSTSTPVSTSLLNSAIGQAEGLNPSDYTAESWLKVQTALETAKTVTGSGSASQTDVNNARNALLSAIGALGVNGNEPYTIEGGQTPLSDGTIKPVPISTSLDGSLEADNDSGSLPTRTLVGIILLVIAAFLAGLFLNRIVRAVKPEEKNAA